jgi:repressor LexA
MERGLSFAFSSVTLGHMSEGGANMEADAAWATAVEFESSQVVDIPLLGVVAAGEPYQAFAIDETLTVPTKLWAGKQVFALRVRGDSMVGDGIHHGDYLIVEPRQQADNGQTVVVEIDGCVTVKKYYREADGQVRLQPANPAMLPLTVRGDHLRVIGIVVGVLRKFGFGGSQPVRPLSALPPRRPATPSRHPPLRQDDASLELGINVIDAQLNRWNAAIAQTRKEKPLHQHIVQMEEMGRDLQTLRDWCARTKKPGLRRALLTEADTLMRRMQRFATLTPVRLPDLVLH